MDRYPKFNQKLLYWFLRLFFYLLYNPLSWTYDFVAATVSVGMWKDWVSTALPYLTGPHVLEIGHGPGHLQAALWKQNRPEQVFGVDLSRTMGRQAQRRLRKLGLNPNLVNGKGQSLPFANAVLDQVAATFPTEYIFKPETLSEVYRVLKPGGQFVVIPGAWITGRSLPDRLAAGLFRLTGQSPMQEAAAPTPAPMIEAGFQVEIQRVKLPRSLVIIVIARKGNAQSRPAKNF